MINEEKVMAAINAQGARIYLDLERQHDEIMKVIGELRGALMARFEPVEDRLTSMVEDFTVTMMAAQAVDLRPAMAVGNRAGLTDAAAARRQAEAAQLPGLELRTVAVPEGGHDGTRLFAALDRALADVPRSRLAGVVMLTDG